jgi:hypothetical protein
MSVELQTTYQTYKNTLQTIASKIGDIEQETEEHKYVQVSMLLHSFPPRAASYTAIRYGSSLHILRAAPLLDVPSISPLSVILGQSKCSHPLGWCLRH